MATGAVMRQVSCAARSRVSATAAATVRELADDLAQHALPVWRPLDLWRTRLAAPRLLPIAAADALRATEELRGLVRWVDDGNCHARAVVGAARIDELLDGVLHGPDQAVRAAVAVVPTSMRRTGWTFHAATAYRSAEDGSVRVIDHLLGARVGNASGNFAIDAWARQAGADPRRVRLQHAVDNIPMGSGPLTSPATPWQVRRLGRELARSIERG